MTKKYKHIPTGKIFVEDGNVVRTEDGEGALRAHYIDYTKVSFEILKQGEDREEYVAREDLEKYIGRKVIDYGYGDDHQSGTIVAIDIHSRFIVEFSDLPGEVFAYNKLEDFVLVD